MRDSRLEAAPAPPEQGGGSAEELAYRLTQQQLTAEFGHFALKTRDINGLLQEAAKICAIGLQSQFSKVMEFLPDEGQFIVRAGVGWKPGVVGHARVGADAESPTGYAYRTGKPVISNHLAGENRFRTPQLLQDHGIKRAINVLVQGERERFGILEVDSPTEGRFTEADLSFIEAFANLLGVAIERQQAEEALRTSEARLQAAIGYNEVLTQEISHRVKNSLAIVASLLTMQGRLSSSPELRSALDDARARVQTIAQVHDQLWRKDDVHSIDLAGFITDLSERLRSSAGAEQTLTCEVRPIALKTDQAVPLGLLVNELVTNAFKYAYPSGKGAVEIVIAGKESGQLQVVVEDRGRGLPANFNVSEGNSLGMKLIASLSRQLGGQPQWHDAQPGTRFVLDFYPL